MDNSPGAERPLRALALEVLRAVDEGLPAGGAARELAVEALRRMAPDTAEWVKAVEVLEGGPLRMRRAVELAGLALDAVEVESSGRETG